MLAAAAAIMMNGIRLRDCKVLVNVTHKNIVIIHSRPFPLGGQIGVVVVVVVVNDPHLVVAENEVKGC